MIPDLNNVYDDETVESDFTVETEPSKTYKLNTDDSVIVGKIDETDALKQAIMKILTTERYENLIYSWNYGIELQDLYGQPSDYVMAELEHRISDALTADDRIESVTDYTAEQTDKESIHCAFTVNTVSGERLNIEQEVTI